MLKTDNRADVRAPDSDDERRQVRRERRFSAIVLLTMAAFTLEDLFEDRADGAPWSHVLSELALVLMATSMAFYLFRLSLAPLLRKSRLLERELTNARADAKKWKADASQLMEGLSAAIAGQLDQWKLTDAEKDIAMFLLKGLSHKEIATIRKTSEQTVRQQAASVYQKSDLTGRNELSAFFLEDLLVRPELKDRKSVP